MTEDIDIKQNICPKCGKPTKKGLCPECRIAETEWLVCDKRVQCTQCPTCNSIKNGAIWSDCNMETEDLIAEIALSAVHLHENMNDYNIQLSHFDPSPNRTSVKIKISGEIYGRHVEDECRTLIVWIKEQCDRCSRYSGGYYAGVIQVRADGRRPDDHERAVTEEIATEIEDSVQNAGERLSFITETKNTKDGVDIVISSHNLGESISREIKKRLGGKVTKHPKLIGEKDGRPLYRITYLIRLPRYQKGEILYSKGKYLEVRYIESGLLKVFDFEDGMLKSLREDEVERSVGNIRVVENALVTHTEGDTAGILDPKSYESREVLIPKWLHIREGSEIRVIRDPENDLLIPVG
ncbi:60S ribosomal export protein NMD3 [Methanoplanus limicola]|uniref:NMD3 family protein n=1 Tax=Methanoplanus limicola DSM 2279 TaxID=937775 RepID=H1Z1Q0_9EURY|nr:60S ribosomal export protein NMD3 [Methanoplanus limicola]EHQ34576.1 NMD3 family protein [Methanoplanus limicola DSM 2279]